MSSILQSLQFGLRMLRKSPGLSTIAVGALALGIGLTTMMFSIVWSVLYRGLPFEHEEQLIHLETNDLPHDQESREVSFHDFLDWREQQTSFEGLTGFYTGTVNLSGAGERPERFEGAFISANAFDQLRMRPMLGRTFLKGEDTPQAEPVVLLGYDVWKNRYASDPNIVGRAIRMNGAAATIIGVMPEGFKFPQSHELWTPLRLDPVKPARGTDDVMSLEVFGRLRDGVSLDQAQLEFVQIAKHQELAYPETNKGIGSVVKPFSEEFIPHRIGALFWTMFGAVSLVLLIACANVANLLLARTALRSKEIAVRTALGAGRARIIMQLLVETLVLAGAGAILGCVLAYFGIQAFDQATAAIRGRPYWIRFDIQPVVLAFIVGITIVSAVVSGLLPALQASRTDINATLKDESRTSSSFRVGRMSRVLVVFEVALACGLLVGAGLMIRSVANLRKIDLGFDMSSRMTARVGLFDTSYPTEESRITFFTELQRRLKARPEVLGAAITTSLPGLGSWGFRYALEGKAYPTREDYPRTSGAIVSPGFFDTFDGKIVAGRDFDDRDKKDGPPVAIINESFAKKVFPNEDPLNKRIQLVGDEKDKAPWLTIVGVVTDLHLEGLIREDDDEGPEGIYIPLAHRVQNFMSIAVNARPGATDLGPMLRDEVASIDPDLPLYWVQTVAQSVSERTYFFRVFGTLFIVFGAVALFLASIGIYGVMAVTVGRRTQEIGVRMALGARARDVVGMVMKQGAWQVGIGLVLGLLLSLGISRLLGFILFDVKPTDPLTFIGISAVLAGTGMLACLIPARRAAKVDPIIALRHD